MSVGSRREQIIGIACALAVVVLWSSFLVLSRYGAAGVLTPFDLTALRFWRSAAAYTRLRWNIIPLIRPWRTRVK